MKTIEEPRKPAEVLHQIRAGVSPKILKKAPLLFNQCVGTTIYELLQNCRRAKASQIEITVLPLTKESTGICISDNGIGIGSPQALLELGESEWEEKIQQNETPAGMGFFSLCHLPGGVHVLSKNWKMHITPDAFIGNSTIPAEKCEPREGTQLRFTIQKDAEHILSIIRACGQFFPVPILLNKKAIPQGGYLDRCEHTKTLNGVRFGVSENHQELGINFHGLVIQTPNNYREENGVVHSCFPFYLRIDILSNEALDLVLPARNAIVKNEKWVHLQAEARRFIYETLQKTKTEHSLPFQFWQEAKVMGIDIPEATPEMTIATQDACHSSCTIEPFNHFTSHCDISVNVKNPPNGRTVAISLHGRSTRLAYYLAAQPPMKGLSGGETLPIPVKDAPNMKGYSWYPSLEITSVEFQAKRGTTNYIWDPEDSKLPKGLHPGDKSEHADKIEAVITLQDSKSTKETEIRIPVEIGFCSGECYEEAEFKNWVPSKSFDESKLSFDTTEVLKALYFCESTDGDCDSTSRQEEEWAEGVNRFLEEIYYGVEVRDLNIINKVLEEWDVQQAISRLGAKNLQIVTKNKQTRLVLKKRKNASKKKDCQ